MTDVPVTHTSSGGAPAEGAGLWDELRTTTQARIGLGRVGHALPTQVELELRLAHQLARDAVHEVLEVEALCESLSSAGFSPPHVAVTQARTRHEYIQRPDLGRRLAPGQSLPPSGAQIGIVLADGLSPASLVMHAGGLLDALRRQVGHRYTVAPLVLAQQARVALGDQVAAAIGVETIVVVIGERPGLSVPHSLGAYITHNPRPDTTDAERNCVSNIHPPEGMGYDEAARSIVGVLDSARILGHTGVRGREGLPGGSPGRTALRPEPARAVATAGPRAERGVSR